MEKRYRALRAIADIYRYLGLLMILGAMVSAAMMIFEAKFLILAVSLAISGFFSVAISEAIYVLIDIEENTRRSAQALENLGSRSLESNL